MIGERRVEHGFLLTAWVFLPDHWHAIFYPGHPLTISLVVEAIKDGATKRINRSRREVGRLWQPRFFDRALRTVKEYKEKVEYIHLNPVRAGRVSRRKIGLGRACMITGAAFDARWTRRAGCASTGCCCLPTSGREYEKSRRGTQKARTSALPAAQPGAARGELPFH